MILRLFKKFRWIGDLFLSGYREGKSAKTKQFIELLKMLAQGQGFATIGIAWDSVSDHLEFSLYISRERDGLILNQKHLSSDELVSLIERIYKEDGMITNL